MSAKGSRCTSFEMGMIKTENSWLHLVSTLFFSLIGANLLLVIEASASTLRYLDCGSLWFCYDFGYRIRLSSDVRFAKGVVATAVTYMRRVYTKKSLTEFDPRLVASTCLYLASKAEESTVQARLLVFYIKKIVPDKYEIKDILEMEMKILEALDYYLVVFHPYRSLSLLLQDAGMNDTTQICWGLVNDTYKMDLILVHPPHLIALACIYVASVLKDKENTAWFEELRVDMNVVKNIAIEILDFYDSHKMITEERIHAAMNKLPAKS